MNVRKLKKWIKGKIKKFYSHKTWNVYNGKPILSISEICRFIKIKVPTKFEDIKSVPITETKLINKLKNKKEIIKKRKRKKYNYDEILEIEQYLRKFKRKYYSQESINNKKDLELLKMLIEWYYYFDNMGFDYDDYFDYEVFNKKTKDLKKYLNKGYKKEIYRACNDRRYTHYCKNKGDFNKKFKKFIQRDWIIAEESSLEEFKSFIKKHPRFFAKPIEGTGGQAAKIIETDGKDLQSLYHECVKNQYICEEIVKQHKEMAQFNASTLNTLRLYTLVPADGKPIITLGNARFGRAGNDVDNFHSGGVSAVIDLKTGKLVSDAINRAHVKVSHHPDTNVKFKGFKIPNFKECKKAVCEAALEIKELRHIGWDIAIAEDGHIEFIEGNAFPNFDITQAADQVGKKDRYEKYIDELINLKKQK